MQNLNSPIVLIAHGSRDPKWQEPFKRFVTQFTLKYPGRDIALCYMEISSPTLLDVCRDFFAKGYQEVVLVPMFMASGGHVDHDIPVQVNDVHTQLPNFSIRLQNPIGEHQRVVDSMLESIYSL